MVVNLILEESPTMKRECRAFTLIELLIVVAIIGILAAIAIPNFLEAQIRAGVARVQSDYRNMKTAMYMYHVDHSVWPTDRGNCMSGDTVLDHSAFWALTELSTPLAYMSTVPFADPFSKVKKNQITCGGGMFVTNHYQYFEDEEYNGPIRYLGPPSRTGDPPSQIPYVSWILINVGPAQVWPGHPGFLWGIPYDATNGTVSQGTLWCSEVGIFGD
jgi:prepilin-type N-terminal cleavage/methylation domain-containing protein